MREAEDLGKDWRVLDNFKVRQVIGKQVIAYFQGILFLKKSKQGDRQKQEEACPYNSKDNQ